MWPFKKKIKSDVVQSVTDDAQSVKPSNPFDCIYKSIIADLEESIIADWKFEYRKSNWEYYHNLKKNYSITCYDDTNEAWLSSIHFSNFSNWQQKTLYRKCQNLWQAMQYEQDRIRKAQDLQNIKSKFPHCFN